jgi:hypothetical protein
MLFPVYAEVASPVSAGYDFPLVVGVACYALRVPLEAGVAPIEVVGFAEESSGVVVVFIGGIKALPPLNVYFGHG